MIDLRRENKENDIRLFLVTDTFDPMRSEISKRLPPYHLRSIQQPTIDNDNPTHPRETIDVIRTVRYVSLLYLSLLMYDKPHPSHKKEEHIREPKKAEAGPRLPSLGDFK